MGDARCVWRHLSAFCFGDELGEILLASLASTIKSRDVGIWKLTSEWRHSPDRQSAGASYLPGCRPDTIFQKMFLVGQPIPPRRNLDEAETFLQPMSFRDAHANKNTQQAVHIFPLVMSNPHRICGMISPGGPEVSLCFLGRLRLPVRS